MTASVLQRHMIVLVCRDKLRDATNELQKKSAAIEELENNHTSSGETHWASYMQARVCVWCVVCVCVCADCG